MNPTPVRPLFIFSLPRSGSTYLQRMLSAHSAVVSANESWFLIPLLYSLRHEGVYAEYAHRVIVDGVEDLCRFLPGGRADYLDEIRQLALRIYGRASGPGHVYYLDKTPRYHLVVDDIVPLFGPDARFVFLWRNPLAVLSSMLDMGGGPRWFPEHHKVDLYTGLGRLVETYERHRAQCQAVNYENLIAQRDVELKEILEYAGLGWEPAMTLEPNERSLVKWRSHLDTPVRRRFARRYLRWIGRDRLAVMGYDLDDLEAQLASVPVRRQIAGDVVHTVRAGVCTALEPLLFREKLAKLRQWDGVVLHK